MGPRGRGRSGIRRGEPAPGGRGRSGRLSALGPAEGRPPACRSRGGRAASAGEREARPRRPDGRRADGAPRARPPRRRPTQAARREGGCLAGPAGAGRFQRAAEHARCGRDRAPFPAAFSSGRPTEASTWTASFSSAGAGALRLYIRQARLPAGSRVYVYGEDGEIQGPYNFSPGIRPEGFWTNTIFSDRIFLEAQLPARATAVGDCQCDAPRRRRRASRAPGLRAFGGREGGRRPEVRHLLHRSQLRDDRRVSERGAGYEGDRAAHVRGRGLVLRLHGRPDEHDKRQLRAVPPDREPLLLE